METTFEKIIRKTGRKPVSCKCALCKSQCAQPCKGTPEDMIKIIGAGFQDRVMKVMFDDVQIIVPLYDNIKKSCTFFTDGLCELHESGLKPTEGKLSHHSTTLEKFNYKKSISFHVVKEWKEISFEESKALVEKYVTTGTDQ